MSADYSKNWRIIDNSKGPQCKCMWVFCYLAGEVKTCRIFTSSSILMKFDLQICASSCPPASHLVVVVVCLSSYETAESMVHMYICVWSYCPVSDWTNKFANWLLRSLLALEALFSRNLFSVTFYWTKRCAMVSKMTGENKQNSQDKIERNSWIYLLPATAVHQITLRIITTSLSYWPLLGFISLKLSKWMSNYSFEELSSVSISFKFFKQVASLLPPFDTVSVSILIQSGSQGKGVQWIGSRRCRGETVCQARLCRRTECLQASPDTLLLW